MKIRKRIRITILLVAGAVVALLGLKWAYTSWIGAGLESHLAASIRTLPTFEPVGSERTVMSALREVGQAMRLAAKVRSSDTLDIAFDDRAFWAAEVRPLFAVFDTPMVGEYPIANPSGAWPYRRALPDDTRTAHILLHSYAWEMADKGKSRAAVGAIINGVRVARDCADHFGTMVGEYGCRSLQEMWLPLFLDSDHQQSVGLKLWKFADEEVRLLCRELDEIDTPRADVRHAVIWNGAAIAMHCLAGLGVRDLAAEDAWSWETDRAIALRVLLAGAELARRLPRELPRKTGVAWRKDHLSELEDRYGTKTIAHLFDSASRVARSRDEATLGLRVLRILCHERLGERRKILDPWGQAIKRRVFEDRVEYWSDGPPDVDVNMVLRYWVDR